MFVALDCFAPPEFRPLTAPLELPDANVKCSQSRPCKELGRLFACGRPCFFGDAIEQRTRPSLWRYSSAKRSTFVVAKAQDAATSEQAINVQPRTEWLQKSFAIRPRARGCHLISREIQDALNPEIGRFRVGIAHIFLQHTSASLTINENADPTVQSDMENSLNRIVPEFGERGASLYEHDSEGSDDMPAHVKTALLGNSLTIPITSGRLNMGIWQGIWFCEHRNYGGPRRVVVTLHGEAVPS
mmetsp:Transcript_6066/g.10446  ORF Transcript_6066/g.10446 Transcript_6066/m.10446 type:complete len:243 (-) Transcript_6066:130-858(-)